MGFGNFAKMAQQMQADMARVEAELLDLRIEGTAGGGAVKAVVTGKQDLVSVTIDPGVVDPDDVEMLQDLVACRRQRGAQPGQGDGGGEARPGHRRAEDPGAVTTVLPSYP